jgi:hypothetical protein
MSANASREAYSKYIAGKKGPWYDYTGDIYIRDVYPILKALNKDRSARGLMPIPQTIRHNEFDGTSVSCFESLPGTCAGVDELVKTFVYVYCVDAEYFKHKTIYALVTVEIAAMLKFNAGDYSHMVKDEQTRNMLNQYREYLGSSIKN